MRYLPVVVLLAWAGAQTTHPNRAYVRVSQAPFLHGVASGDPLTDRVIVWTRITPPQSWTGPVTVSWEVASDPQFTQIVASGTTSTDADRDYTVKVDATGLQAGRWYWYRFQALNTYSPVGRTRTLPLSGVNRLRLAVVSCADYQNGFYTAYENICLRNDVDFVLHLGDYIYEYGPQQNSVRQSEPLKETVTLEDYRIRYSHYRLDTMLQWLHQNYPMIPVWDDHELANDAWKAGAQNHDSSTEGPFLDRKKAMLRAYHEWMPFRMPDPNDSLRIWRSFSMGGLMDLILLDTRHYDRDQQVTSSSFGVPANDATLNDPSRSILGPVQRAWLVNQLKNSTATWRFIGQQIMMEPLTATVLGTRYVVNPDQWDGYPADRRRIMDSIIQNNISNVVVLSGDIHTSWGNDLPFGPGSYDPTSGSGSTAVEFVSPSITSANASFLGNFSNTSIIKSQNPHVKYVNVTRHGYVVIDVTPQKVQGDWYFANTVSQPQPGETTGESWYVNSGERFLRKATSPTTAPAGYNPPLVARGQVTSALACPGPVLVGVYPNPAQDFVTLQLYTSAAETFTLCLATPSGQRVACYTLATPSAGTHYYQVPLDELSNGVFLLTIQTAGGKSQTYRLMKR